MIPFKIAVPCLLILLLTACHTQSFMLQYQGRPFVDAQYTRGTQTIPGRLECAYFDLGGEGVAFHDTDAKNSGSGALNPADGTYLNEFRMGEAVDVSYTKFREPGIDNSPYNFVVPAKDQLYVGWTAPGEWINYTINVKETRTYYLGLMYTAREDGQIAFSVNGKRVGENIRVPSTYVKEDSIPWRQWHHWNYLKDAAAIKLKKGLQVITLHTVLTGQMNYEYLDFK